MRRKIAFLLLAALLAALLVPIAVAEENGFVLPAAVGAAAGTEDAAGAETAAEPAGTTAVAAAAAEAEGTAAPEEAAGPGEPDVSGPAVILPTRIPAGETAEPDIHFSDLRGLVEKNNYTYRTLEQNLKLIGSSGMDSTAMKQAVTRLRDTKWQLEMLFKTVSPLDIHMSALFGTLIGLLDVQINTMEQQIKSSNTSLNTTMNSLKDTMNQMVKGVESLYIVIVTLEASTGDIERYLERMDRMVALTEKQQELGMASVYDVETIRQQRRELQSRQAVLLYNIKVQKITLESMLGIKDKDGTLVLEPLTMPTEEEIAAIDYKTQVEAARKQNVDVKNGDWKVWEDSTAAAEYELYGAEDTFDYKFRLLCLAVPEQQRLVQEAAEKLAFQRRTLEIAEKKYELGMLSHEEYLAADSDVKDAESGLTSAQLDLFTAYRNYWWACKHGIV